MIYSKFGSPVEIIKNYGDIHSGGCVRIRFIEKDMKGEERDTYTHTLKATHGIFEIEEARNLLPITN